MCKCIFYCKYKTLLPMGMLLELRSIAFPFTNVLQTRTFQWQLITFFPLFNIQIFHFLFALVGERLGEEDSEDGDGQLGN